MYKVIISRIQEGTGRMSLLGHLVVIDIKGKIVFECDTLESVKYQIPSGFYYCPLTYSIKFRRKLFEVDIVRNRSGIRFHEGNTYVDTTGCILLGTACESIYDNPKEFTLKNSRKTCDDFASIVGNSFILELDDLNYELPF